MGVATLVFASHHTCTGKHKFELLYVLSQGNLPYKNIVDCGRQLIAKDGVLQMWRGYFTYAGRCAPHAMICLLTMDTFVSLFNMASGLK